MALNNSSLIKSVLVGAVVIVTAASSMAQVTMALDTSSLSSFDEYVGISATLGGSPLITAGADWIGLYQFDVEPGSNPAIQSSFYSVCLSPLGNLPPGEQTYNYESLASASKSANPAAWAHSGNQYYGVQNATYLLGMYSAAITSGKGYVSGLIGTSADQGTALALAMYAALYNSTGYGMLGGSSFVNTTGTGVGQVFGAVDKDYMDILSMLTPSKAASGSAAEDGGVLVPEDPGSQEFELLSTDLPAGFGVVPEPTTLIAGALLLVPFGASVLRVIRKGWTT